MFAFFRALLTGPFFGLIAIVRSWLWVLAVMGAIALLAEVESLSALLSVLVGLLVAEFLLAYSLSREALVAVGGQWAIQPDVSWWRAAMKYLGASLLALVWQMLAVAALVFVIILAAPDLPETAGRNLSAWIEARAEDPAAAIPNHERIENILRLLSFVITLPLAVFTTTFVAAAAGNGLLSGTGWTIGFGTLRVVIAATVYAWVSWRLLVLFGHAVMEWNSPVAVTAVQIAAWALNWAMLMGFAAQIYLRRVAVEAGTTRAGEELARPATAGAMEEARNAEARAIRMARMQQRD